MLTACGVALPQAGGPQAFSYLRATPNSLTPKLSSPADRNVVKNRWYFEDIVFRDEENGADQILKFVKR